MNMLQGSSIKPNLYKLYLPLSPQYKQKATQFTQSNYLSFSPNEKYIRCHQTLRGSQILFPRQKVDDKGGAKEVKNEARKGNRNLKKWSISRMLEKIVPEPNTIKYISHLYKKSGRKEISVRKGSEKDSAIKGIEKEKLKKMKTKNEDRTYFVTLDSRYRQFHTSQTQKRKKLGFSQEEMFRTSKKRVSNEERKTVIQQNLKLWKKQKSQRTNRYQ